MRWTSMGATQSEQLQLDYVSARNWIILALSALLLGYADTAAAQWQREVRFINHDDSLLSTGGGPYLARAPIDPGRTAPGPAPSPAIPEPSAIVNAAEYWNALADLNLAGLRGAAVTDQSSLLNALALDKTGARSTIADGVVFGIGGTGKRADKLIRTLPLELGEKTMQLSGVVVYGPVYSGMINCDGILGSDIARYGTIRIDATNGVFAIGLSPLREYD